jgi:hypothetical protein
MRREVQQIDAWTGEVLQGAQLALIYPKRKNGFQQGGWLAMAQTPMELIATTKGLGEQALRVSYMLAARIDFENWINVNQAELGERLGMKRQHVGRALADLEQLGMLLRGPKVGRNVTWRLNPAFGWKGSAKNHKTALRDQLSAKGLTVIEGGAQ